jgi:hypothetical protein
VPEVTQYTERILIVLNPDASIKGIAVDDLQLIDGVPVKQIQVAADAITDTTVQALLEEIGASTAVEVVSLRSQVAELTAEVARLTALIPPPIDPNAVPATITRTQARLVLHRAGLLDTVLQIIEAGGIEAQIWYEANEWNRASPVLDGMAQALGFTDEQVDNLFRAAGAIVL